MSEESERLKKRTMEFALSVCSILKELPREEPGPTARHQLAKAVTGMAFNYRASCRARSHAEYTSRIGVVSEEAPIAQPSAVHQRSHRADQDLLEISRDCAGNRKAEEKPFIW